MADKKISELNAKDLQPEDTMLAVGPTEDYRASASSIGRYVLEDYAGTQFAGKNQAISSAIGAASLSGLGDGTVTGAIKEVNTRIDTKAEEINARIDAKVKESVDQSAITYAKKADMTEVVKELASADTKADTSIKALQSADETMTKKIQQNATQISSLKNKILQVEATASSAQSATNSSIGDINTKINAVKDYVIDQYFGPERGNWSWRKWNSGLCEMWVLPRVNSTSGWARVGSSELWKYTDYFRLPIKLIALADVQLTTDWDGWATSASEDSSLDSLGRVYFTIYQLTGSAGLDKAHTIRIYVRGRYK